MERDTWEHISAPLARVLEKAAQAMREREEREAAAKRRKLAEEALGR